MVPGALEDGLMMMETLLSAHGAGRKLAAAADLPLEEVLCLFVLYSRKPSSVKELTQHLVVRGSRTSKLLESLENRGYVTRTLSLIDRRREEVMLTGRGTYLIEQILRSAAEPELTDRNLTADHHAAIL
jgi:DNA-binding MarR family transcriptional regulator